MAAFHSQLTQRLLSLLISVVYHASWSAMTRRRAEKLSPDPGTKFPVLKFQLNCPAILDKMLLFGFSVLIYKLKIIIVHTVWLM